MSWHRTITGYYALPTHSAYTCVARSPSGPLPFQISVSATALRQSRCCQYRHHKTTISTRFDKYLSRRHGRRGVLIKMNNHERNRSCAQRSRVCRCSRCTDVTYTALWDSTTISITRTEDASAYTRKRHLRPAFSLKFCGNFNAGRGYMPPNSAVLATVPVNVS